MKGEVLVKYIAFEVQILSKMADQALISFRIYHLNLLIPLAFRIVNTFSSGIVYVT